MTDMDVDTGSIAIDEDLQSRQMAVYGRESMQKLKTASVLISGLNGLGAEVAKNVILANVKAVTLHDDKAATAADAGSHFYLGEAEVGKNRATVCAQQMQELNPGVEVRSAEGPFPLEHLSNFTIVVAIDVPLDIALKADAFCRAQSPPIAFIRADVRGLCGMVFADFGPTFTCLDPTGESIKARSSNPSPSRARAPTAPTPRAGDGPPLPPPPPPSHHLHLTSTIPSACSASTTRRWISTTATT